MPKGNLNHVGFPFKREPISKKLRFSIFERDGFACRYCGASPPDVTLHVDHEKPVSAGGRNHPDNLVTACQDCNLGKAATSIRPLMRCSWEFTVAAIAFGEAIKKFGSAVTANDYLIMEDFCFSEVDPCGLAAIVARSASREEVIANIFATSFPPSEAPTIQ